MRVGLLGFSSCSQNQSGSDTKLDAPPKLESKSTTHPIKHERSAYCHSPHHPHGCPSLCLCTGNAQGASSGKLATTILDVSDRVIAGVAASIPVRMTE